MQIMFFSKNRLNFFKFFEKIFFEKWTTSRYNTTPGANSSASPKSILIEIGGVISAADMTSK
jgi:hypothetical protein